MEMETLLAQADENLRALELFSRYLNLCPRFARAEDVRRLTAECGVDEETAVRLLVAAAMDVDDRRMEEGYLKPGIRKLDANECRRDPYYQTIRLPELKRGSWRMGYKTIAPYELFTADDLLRTRDGREIPQAGFFSEAFRAPVVEENGREWMTVTPSEINTMTADVEAARGRVAVFGLGLGYYAFMVSRKESVTHVTVIERDESVISLFREFVLPQFPNAEKIEVVQADAFAYADGMGGLCFDTAYVDIWHDVLDGVELYLRMKRLECRSPGTMFRYWIEPSMLAWLRGMALWEVGAGETGPMLRALGGYASADELRQKLTDDTLRHVASIIDLSVARR